MTPRSAQSRLFALRGDLVASREVADREALGARVKASLEAIRRRASARWRSALELSAGIDELTGLTEDPSDAFDAAVSMNLAVWPERFRWALASGGVDFGVRERTTTRMDGPVFHRSRAGIERARREGIAFAVEAGEGIDGPGAGLAEAAGSWLLAAMERWTARQVEVVSAARELETQAEVGARLGITQGTVSQHLRAAGYDAMVRTERAMRAWLSSLERE